MKEDYHTFLCALLRRPKKIKQENVEQATNSQPMTTVVIFITTDD